MYYKEITSNDIDLDITYYKDFYYREYFDYRRIRAAILK